MNNRLLKLLIYLILSPITIFFILLQRLISPFLILRISEIRSNRIGHFVGETSIIILSSNKKMNDKKIVDLWFPTSYIANKFYFKKLKKKLIILPKYILHPIYLINKYLPNNHKFTFPIPLSSDRDINGVIKNNPSVITFTKSEKNFGNNQLLKLGLNPEDIFVCLNVRDSEYLKVTHPNHDFSYHDYKDSKIDSLNLTANFLQTKNIKLVRMGSIVKDLWKSSSPNVIDYANSELRSDFLDFYLTSKCKFFITNGNGFMLVPQIFKKPIAVFDYVPVGQFYSFIDKSICIFKKYYCNNRKKILTLNEIFSIKAFSYVDGRLFKKDKIELINNSPEEILELVKEMNSHLDSNFNFDLDDKQKDFWKSFPIIKGICLVQL